MKDVTGRSQMLHVSLSAEMHAGVTALAIEAGLSPEDLVSGWIRNRVSGASRTPFDVRRRLQAESNLLAAVDAKLEQLRIDDDWDKDVTGSVFRWIQAECLDLYKIAISGGDASRVNRGIGARVKRALAADAIDDGRLEIGRPAPGETSLVTKWTRLRRQAERHENEGAKPMKLASNATLEDIAIRTPNPREFVRLALGRMFEAKSQAADGVVLVRIGVTGFGLASNYRTETAPAGTIEATPEDKRAFRMYHGRGLHREVTHIERDQMKPENWSSQTLSLEEVQSLLGRLRAAA